FVRKSKHEYHNSRGGSQCRGPSRKTFRWIRTGHCPSCDRSSRISFGWVWVTGASATFNGIASANRHDEPRSLAAPVTRLDQIGKPTPLAFRAAQKCTLIEGQMHVTHMDHCSVIITDIARSRHFYRELLGLKEIAPPKTFDFVVLWFDLGGRQTLHLLLKPKADSISPRHFALHVDDAQAAREHLRSRGVAIEETTPIPHCDRFF